MSTTSSGSKTTSYALLAIGVVLMGAALVMDFMGSQFGLRGTMLIVGALCVLAGLYFYPSVEHHRSIINIIFLFPLLFTFLVTVIIPLILGIGYSFTDSSVSDHAGLNRFLTLFSCSLNCGP